MFCAEGCWSIGELLEVPADPQTLVIFACGSLCNNMPALSICQLRGDLSDQMWGSVGFAVALGMAPPFDSYVQIVSYCSTVMEICLPDPVILKSTVIVTSISAIKGSTE